MIKTILLLKISTTLNNDMGNLDKSLFIYLIK